MGAFARARTTRFNAASVARTAAAVFALSVLAPNLASAQGAEDGKRAAAEFAEGQRAFTSGDFQHAAEQFEAAYRDKPHHAPLWNAARSWDRAGEVARAANLYARYLREAPPDAPDRDAATAALRAISPRLVKLEIHAAEGVTNVTVDGKPVDGEMVYVTSGDHVIDGKKGDARAHKDQSGRAGDQISVLLDATAPAPATAPVVAPEPNNNPPALVTVDDSPRKSHGLSPIFVVVGSVLTVAAAGVTVWSGVDTLSQKDTFDTERTQANLDDGRSKQKRTNILLGVTGGLAVVTGVTAIFLTDWGKKSESPTASPSRATPRLRAGIGPGTIVLGGTF
jgi:hypothetical protein